MLVDIVGGRRGEATRSRREHPRKIVPSPVSPPPPRPATTSVPTSSSGLLPASQVEAPVTCHLPSSLPPLDCLLTARGSRAPSIRTPLNSQQPTTNSQAAASQQPTANKQPQQALKSSCMQAPTALAFSLSQPLPSEQRTSNREAPYPLINFRRLGISFILADLSSFDKVFRHFARS